MSDAEELKQTIRVAVSGVAKSKRQVEDIVANVFQAVYPMLVATDELIDAWEQYKNGSSPSDIHRLEMAAGQAYHLLKGVDA